MLNIHKKANYKGKYYRKPVERIWEHTDGRVILDKDNHPVRKIPDLPATLSSEVEGVSETQRPSILSPMLYPAKLTPYFT